MKRIVLMSAFTSMLLMAQTGWAQDDREVIYMSGEQRAFVLTEMRAFLVAVQDIVLAVADNDMETIKETARAMGPGSGMGMQMGLPQVLPVEFRQMARGTHMAFSELAQAAEFGPEGVIADLGTLMSSCNGCHEAYQLQTKP